MSDWEKTREAAAKFGDYSYAKDHKPTTVVPVASHATQTTPSTSAQEAVAGWRYSINYGPDGEENYANVYAADGQFVGNLRTYHAIAICNAFAVCDKLASPSPAGSPASPSVDVGFPMGAIENGRAFADRLEMTGLECPAGDIRMCSDWQEFRRCFDWLAQWALDHASLASDATALAKAEGLGQRADATPKNPLPGEIAP